MSAASPSADALPDFDELLVGREGSLGLLRLNRPKVLNSLTLGMVRAMDAALDRFEMDPTIRAVWMIGEGERAFCAGGDIRALHDAGKAGTNLPETFWREEYRLDDRISRFAKPVVAVLNGITMGGGVGLAGHASHRITIERTRFAMPENGIGFFPDVGASWLLTRSQSAFGTYVALCGNPCGPAETIAAGIGDRFVPEESLGRLRAELASLPEGAGHAEVTDLIDGLAKEPPPALDPARHQLIDRCFQADSIEGILAALGREDDPFARETAATLLQKSPTSLKVTLDLYRQGRKAPSLRDCFEREFAVATQMIESHDFYEGVRAAIIDKDRNPRWSPATLDDVSDAAVQRYFTPRHASLFA